ncbi:MAG: helix-turn-helix transcriptional regulator [Clostridia bacterium]|nr:helix-turn-helix transcriptional regulator [Clostridia bacterium]
MQLPIGNTIKQLRKEREITQEELAEILGISCQSVSRWENNSCYPDMELLPAIASYFDITIDTLLGYDRSVERQVKLIEELSLKIKAGMMEDVTAEIRNAIQIYPKNIALQIMLVTTLFNCHTRMEAKEQRNTLEEIVTLCRKILRTKASGYDPLFSNENTILLMNVATKNILIPALIELGRYEEAHEVAVVMPTVTMTREFTIPMTLKGASKKEFLLDNLPLLLLMTMKTYISGIIHSEIETDPAEPMGNINPCKYTLDDYKRDIHILETVYSMLGNYTDSTHELCSNIVYLLWNHHAAKLSADEGDFDGALHHFQKVTEWLVYPNSKRRNSYLTGTLFRNFVHEAPGKLAENDIAQSPAYIFLHGYADAGYFAGLETAPDAIRREYTALTEKIRLHVGAEA